VATLLGIERALKKQLPGNERLKIAAAVGSDLPLFLVGGTVLGVEHGECVYPLLISRQRIAWSPSPKSVSPPRELLPIGTCTSRQKLTASDPSARMKEFGRTISAWLSGPTGSSNGSNRSRSVSGAPALGGGRVGNPLLSLVQAGIAERLRRSRLSAASPNCMR